MTQFEHGGNIETFAQSINAKVEDIIDLSSNINFLKPTINIDFNKLDISAYPTYDKLYDAIAKNYTIQNNQLELFNGGSSAIFSLFSFLNLKTCTIFSPAYLEYKKAATLFNYKIKHINRFENTAQTIEKNSLVIFVNPSTPDGSYTKIEKLINQAKEQNATLLIDESFLDFTPYESATKYLETYDKLYILKSMTKFYSSASIRVGALLSNEQNIQALKSKQPQWKLSHFDSIYLQEALKDKPFKEQTKEVTLKNRELLITILKNKSIVKTIFPSCANYVLVQLKAITATTFQEQLKPFKIMIRDCSNFDFLDESYVRIAVKSEEDINALEKALKEIQKDNHAK